MAVNAIASVTCYFNNLYFRRSYKMKSPTARPFKYSLKGTSLVNHEGFYVLKYKIESKTRITAIVGYIYVYNNLLHISESHKLETHKWIHILSRILTFGLYWFQHGGLSQFFSGTTLAKSLVENWTTIKTVKVKLFHALSQHSVWRQDEQPWKTASTRFQQSEVISSD